MVQGHFFSVACNFRCLYLHLLLVLIYSNFRWNLILGGRSRYRKYRIMNTTEKMCDYSKNMDKGYMNSTGTSMRHYKVQSVLSKSRTFKIIFCSDLARTVWRHMAVQYGIDTPKCMSQFICDKKSISFLAQICHLCDKVQKNHDQFVTSACFL